MLTHKRGRRITIDEAIEEDLKMNPPNEHLIAYLSSIKEPEPKRKRLTPEEMERIKENRAKAVAIRADKRKKIETAALIKANQERARAIRAQKRDALKAASTLVTMSETTMFNSLAVA